MCRVFQPICSFQGVCSKHMEHKSWMQLPHVLVLTLIKDLSQMTWVVRSSPMYFGPKPFRALYCRPASELKSLSSDRQAASVKTLEWTGVMWSTFLVLVRPWAAEFWKIWVLQVLLSHQPFYPLVIWLCNFLVFQFRSEPITTLRFLAWLVVFRFPDWSSVLAFNWFWRRVDNHQG